MRVVLNVVWLIFGGLTTAISWAIAGIVMCLLLVTIPFGLQAFKLASFAIWPFGRTLVKKPDAGAASKIGNVIWFVLVAWWLALIGIATSVLLALTVIGIPLALANLKLVVAALLPFGREVVPIDEVGDREIVGLNFGSL